MKTLLFGLIAMAAGFLGGLGGSHWRTSQQTLRAESLELTDKAGNRIFLGAGRVGSTFQFFDSLHHLRAELLVSNSSSGFELRSKNEKLVALLGVNDGWQSFSMNQNGLSRLGFGLQPDDTGGTKQQNWLFYSGSGGVNGAKAILGSESLIIPKIISSGEV